MRSKLSEIRHYHIDDMELLWVDGIVQSIVNLDDSATIYAPYIEQIADLIWQYQIKHTPEHLQVLHLGVGGGSLPRWVASQIPSARQIGVDIDSELIDYARSHLNLTKSPTLKVRIGDALDELRKMPSDRFQIIVRDVFSGPSAPAHLSSEEFYAEVRRVLTGNGIYIANIIDGAQNAEVVQSEQRRAKAFFGSAEVIKTFKSSTKHHEKVNYLLLGSATT